MYTVLVIDDSLSMRRILKDLINNIDEFEVIAEDVDAFDAAPMFVQAVNHAKLSRMKSLIPNLAISTQ